MTELTTARKRWRREWEHFSSKINFGASFLDARAIQFMNEIENYIDALENKGKVIE